MQICSAEQEYECKFCCPKTLSMIATKTKEESRIKFGMVKKRVGGGVFSFYPPPPPQSKKRCYGPV